MEGGGDWWRDGEGENGEKGGEGGIDRGGEEERRR